MNLNRRRRAAVIAYTGRSRRKAPTTAHTHDWGRVHAVKGRMARWGCVYCPVIDPWIPVSIDPGFTSGQHMVDAMLNGPTTPEEQLKDSLGDDILFDEEVIVDGFPVGTKNEDDPAEQLIQQLSSMTKPELMDAYSQHGLFKSWTKDKMIDWIVRCELKE